MRKLLFILLCISVAAAQNSSTRSVKWSYDTGDYIVASPAIHDNVLLVGSANGNLYALNSTNGSLIWKYGKVGRIESSPALSSSMVFFGSNDGYMYALLLNGTFAWKFKTGDKVLSSPTLAYGFLYFGSTDGGFYALDAATGKMQWNYSGFLAFSSSPVASNWVVYAGSDENRLYAFQVYNGTVLWSQKFPGKLQSSFALSPDNILYFPCKDGNIYAIYTGDGSKLWNVSTGTEAQSSVYYDAESGLLYFGTTDNNVYAARADGHILWKYSTENWVISTPLLSNGVLYVGSYDGKLYAISTLHTTFSSAYLDATGSPVLIHGESSADAGMKYVQVRVENGEWINATGTEMWVYPWDTSAVRDGRYNLEVRGIDANGNVEMPPYQKTVVWFKKESEKNELFVSFMETTLVGTPIRFEVKDAAGKPVPYPEVVIFGKTYVGNERGVVERDENGSAIKAETFGEFNFTVSKEGYSTKVSKIKILMVFDIVPYVLASILLLLAILVSVAYLIMKRLRGVAKKQ